MRAIRRLALSVAVVATVAPAPARAAFHGANGAIAYVKDNTRIVAGNRSLAPAFRYKGIAQTDNVAPAWSPDGRQLAFSSVRMGGPPSFRVIFAESRDGSHRHPLSPLDAAGSAGAAAWSPDGRKVAYSLSQDDPSGMGYISTIYAVPANGGRKRKLVRLPLQYIDAISWSPNGRTLAFSAGSTMDCGQAIYTVASNGRGLRTLATNDDLAAAAPPPDNGQSDQPPPDGQGFGPIDGGGAAQATPQAPGAPAHPDWSPDGKAILFSRQPPDRACSPNALDAEDNAQGVYEMTAAGTDQKRIVAFGEDPSYSPDGKQIVFHDTRASFSPVPVDGDVGYLVDDRGISTAARDGTNVKLVTAGSATQPAWGPRPHG